MVDNFSLALAHILLGIMVWRLLAADSLDREEPPAPLAGRVAHSRDPAEPPRDA